MISFPIIKDIKIASYGLYPGAEQQGLNLEFTQGLTLILGANGLGKSTIITMLFRILTGPFDLILPSGSIGTSEIKAASLNKNTRMAFAARVNDGAQNAQATLIFELGDRIFSVKRSLRDLSLLSFGINDGSVDATEDAFQREICAASGLATFGEWILVLRTVVFFFEDRRGLVWDATAQKQLLRCLLLPPEHASRWAKAERDILEADTRMRNLNSALRREQRETAKIEYRTRAAPGIVAALRAAELAAERLGKEQAGLAEKIESLDQARHRNRLDTMRSEALLDEAAQELERARLSAVEIRFPSADESTRYIFSRLMADDQCLVCNTRGLEDKRKSMLMAIDSRRCLVCDSPLNTDSSPVVELAEERIDALREKVKKAQEAHFSNKQDLEESTDAYNQESKRLSECATELAELQEKIDFFINQLPPEEQSARRQHEDLKALEHRVVALRAVIKENRESFSHEMNKYREAIRGFADEIKKAFEAAAQGFLLEDSGLSWSPYRSQVGQAGAEGVEPIEYPAFGVELSGSDFTSVIRRDGPDQVSESQREFIDLAFRMALISVTAKNHAGTIVIDAPESSLDAVFVERAANVLSRFANGNGVNRLIVTSNLAAGELIPTLLIDADPSPERRRSRIVDLFQHGVPTRAMREMADDYEKLRERLYSQISKSVVADDA